MIFIVSRIKKAKKGQYILYYNYDSFETNTYFPLPVSEILCNFAR